MGWISIGMLRTVIFSQKVAQGGVLKHIDGLWRNPLTPGTVNFAISSGQAVKIKDTQVAATSNLGDYLENLFETSSRNALLPQKTLNNFFIDLKTQGIEPTIPLIKYGSKDINIVGTALFKGDKMVGRIKQPETRALLLLKENFIKGNISLEVKDYMVSYYIQQMETDITPIYQDGNFLFNIDLNLEVDIIENTSSKRLIENKSALHDMERHLASALTKETNHLFNKLQHFESDAVGIGKLVKAKYPERFSTENWPQQFKQADIKVNLKVDARRIGIAS
jgi:spore germination protein